MFVCRLRASAASWRMLRSHSVASFFLFKRVKVQRKPTVDSSSRSFRINPASYYSADLDDRD